jgi:asparagine synthase (glutamine-hydrolysing)
MPGIVGIISLRPPEECQRLVKAMVASMQHEPFYVSGACSAPEMGIHAGWVAHENSFAAGQVFVNEQHDIMLVFSGECFLQSNQGVELREKGHQIGTNKASWLVHLYEEEGERFFEKLNGLFSGLLVDKRQRKAFLFNDRYGVERIYWHECADGFYFASEAKALLRILPELRGFDQEGVAQFLAFGCTLDQRTLFRGISILPGASLCSFEEGSCRMGNYFSPNTWEKQQTLSVEDFQTQYEETFKRILPRYFESESRIGISLTAGLDTRMILACLPETTEKPVSYTFSGEKRDTYDASLSAAIAERCGLEHRILRIQPDFFSNFATHADQTVYLTDGCLGITGAHEIYMNKQARQLAAVRLTGVFGGEIFRGVCMFKPLGLSPRLVNHELRRVQGTISVGEHPVTFAAFREIPWKRFATPAAGRFQTGFRTPYLDNEIVALAYQTPEALRLSSESAVRLIQKNNMALSEIPTDMGELGKSRGWAAPRRVFAKATFKLDHLFNEGLPQWMCPLDSVFRPLSSLLGLIGLHKHLHYRSWFRRELAGWVNDALTDARTRRRPFWHPDFLDTMARDHTSGRGNYVEEINAVLTLDAVERLLFRDFAREKKTASAEAVPLIA